MTSWTNGEEHRALREMLGAFTLGHLDDADQTMVQAHLDGCTSCRADLAEISPLAGLLSQVDVDRFDLPPLPPADLGGAIRAQVAAERETRDTDELGRRRSGLRRRTTTRALLATAAAAVVLAALAGGAVLGRTTAPEVAASAPAPTVESVALRVEEPTIEIASSGLVDHTWGVELRMVGTGFDQDEVFEAWFRDRETGEFVAAGAFIGTGQAPVTCNLQSALMRDRATQVVVTDESGAVVLTAAL